MGKKRTKRMYDVATEFSVKPQSKVKSLKAVLDNSVVKQSALHKQIGSTAFDYFIEQFAYRIAKKKIEGTNKVEIIEENQGLGVYSPIVKFTGELYLIQAFPLSIAGGDKKSQVEFFCKKLERTINQIDCMISQESENARIEKKDNPDYESPYLNAGNINGNVIMCPFDINPESRVRDIVSLRVPNTKFVNLYAANPLIQNYR